jgi:hypothetical protein
MKGQRGYQFLIADLGRVAVFQKRAENVIVRYEIRIIYFADPCRVLYIRGDSSQDGV